MACKISIIVFLVATSIFGCTAIPEDLKPVTGFEAERYLGKWYEIARFDHGFERHLNNVSATYARGDNGDILVVNKGYNFKTGEWKQIEGRARFLGSETVGSLKVSFFGPFYGGYHIIALDKQNYSYSMVTGPSRSYLWILSRTTTLDDAIYADLVTKAIGWGFDTAKLIKVEHNVPDD
jgi:apolipoprotein D and lipocalin family protein